MNKCENRTPELKKDQVRRVREGESTCPFCGSDESEGGPWDSEVGKDWNDVSCRVCDRLRASHETMRKAFFQNGK